MTTHTDLIARLREDEENCHENAGEAADALESLEQQVAAQQAQMYEDRRQALVWRDQVAALTKENHDLANKLTIAWNKPNDQLAASQAREAKLREALENVNAAYDKVSDGLQDDLENGVKWLNEQAAQKFNKEYPGVVKALDALLEASISADEALALPADDSALQARLKEERERCIAVCEETADIYRQMHNPEAENVADACADAIRSMT